MPPKPDLVFNTAPTAIEIDHLAFNVSNSKEESETKVTQFVLSFAQSFEHVKSPRHFDQPIETFILAATSVSASPKSNCIGKRRNRKAWFICKSMDHLIKDCDYYSKQMAQPTPRNYANRGHHKQYAPLTHSKPQKHRVPTTVLTQSKPVSNTAVRPISVALPNITVTRPRHAHQVVTKSKSPIRRHITRNPSSRTSNSPPRVNAVQVPVVSAVQGKQGTWGNPQQALKDKGVIDSGCSRHMTGNMSYLSDFEELNGGYVAFGGNLKRGKITGKGKIKTGNLVRGLPTKVFKNDHNCVACKKGKQHIASCKTNPISSVDQPLFRLHMDLFGSTFVKSLNKKSYSLDITNDYSRFTWVFFLATKNETTTFLTGLENQLSLKVKVIRSDNETKFKNSDLNQFYGLKRIKREFSVPRTPQQNSIAERKNRTLIEAARTMLVDSLLPIPFWTEAVNTACYVQNRVLVTKPHNKTLYELLHGRTPSIGFMRPFDYPVTILNTLEPLGKFQGKVNEGFLVGYSKLETLKGKKEGVDGKLAGLLTALKDLDNLIENQWSDKNKEGLGYSVVPPPPA
nr:putative ribonuclease H-like domain-containing protein [Tanacetum cinerariifolium]